MTDPDIPDDSSIHPAPPGRNAGRADAEVAGEPDQDLMGVPSYLRAFLEVTSPVNVATGIIMGTQDCSQHQARALLKSAADRRRRPIEAIAAGIIASMDTFRCEDPPIP
jgi:hypothetical protein